MPVSAATRPESDAITAATPVAVISRQLQERLERERRWRSWSKELEMTQLGYGVAQLRHRDAAG